MDKSDGDGQAGRRRTVGVQAPLLVCWCLSAYLKGSAVAEDVHVSTMLCAQNPADLRDACLDPEF
jgi:hypothetical protein